MEELAGQAGTHLPLLAGTCELTFGPVLKINKKKQCQKKLSVSNRWYRLIDAIMRECNDDEKTANHGRNGSPALLAIKA